MTMCLKKGPTIKWKLGCCSRKQMRKNSTNHKMRERALRALYDSDKLQSWTKVLGEIRICGALFQFTHAQSLPSKERWTGPEFQAITSSHFHSLGNVWIECFHSRGQDLCKFIGTKESACIRKEFNSHRIGLRHKHGRRFIVLGHQYGRRNVMWKHS